MQKKQIWLIGALIVIASAYLSTLYLKSDAYKHNIVKKIQNRIYTNETKMYSVLTYLAQNFDFSNYDSLFYRSVSENNQKNTNNGLFIFEDTTLKYWNNTKIPIHEIAPEKINHKSLLLLSNGWYLCYRIDVINGFSSPTKHILSLLKIKHNYPFENDYLKNGFVSEFLFDDNISIKFDDNNKNTIISSDGTYLFSIYFNSKYNYRYWSIIIAIAYIVGGLMFCIAIAKFFARSKLQIAILVSILILALRYLLMIYKLPDIWYHFLLFKPEIYAAHQLIPSLGDLFIHFLCIGTIFYLIINAKKSNSINKILPYMGILVLFIFGFFVFFISKSFIYDSNISFEVNNIYNISYYTIISYLTIGLLVIGFYLLLTYLIKKIPVQTQKRKMLLALAIAIILASIYHFAMAVSIGFIIVLTYTYQNNKTIKTWENLTKSLVLMIVYTFFITSILFNSIKTNEKHTTELIAYKIGIENDPIAEYLFNTLETKLETNNWIQKKLENFPATEIEIVDYIKKNFLKGYWNNFENQIIICKKYDNLIVEPANTETNCWQFFNNKIKNESVPTYSKNLHCLNNNTSRINYIGQINYVLSRQDSINIYLSLDSKFFTEKIGYPEILLDKNITDKIDFLQYDYAIYKNNVLQNVFGNYNYSMTLSTQNTNDGYYHFIYKINNNTSVVVSKKNKPVWLFFTLYSYSFLIFIGLFIIILLFYKLFFSTSKFRFKYTSKIQTVILSILILSLLVISGATLYHINNQYNVQQKENIKEKLNSILIEISHKLGSYDMLDIQMQDYLTMILTKFSNVFFIDINLYDLDGKLLASSRPEVFEQGLTSKNMDINAYNAIILNQKSQYIQEENIGKLNFLSAYSPFQNNMNQTTAILNVPYFSKQTTFKQETSNFLTALLNIYVFLIVISVLITFYLSSRITNSLKIIQTHIAQIKLEKQNDKIPITSNDEIGELVKEYNRMVEELTIKAELLSKSQRESAWREMAKQIAHEIKNPLTPMRLNVQYLSKMLSNNNDEDKEKIEKFTHNMLEQIDTLSSIASAFSDFARLPKPTPEKIDITMLIQTAIQLFNNYEVQIIFNLPENKYFVFADKNMLLRVFNNLIKNSIQAIYESHNKDNGQIIIDLHKSENTYQISISDNGKGIPKYIQEKIFEPNFTTKSSGTGLGLAMSKNIIKSMQGNISYTTNPKNNMTTQFFVQLPMYSE